MTPSRSLKLGTRGSALARWQAQWVADRLAQIAGVNVQLVVISTHGDRDQREAIGALGAQGVFTKELQRALLADEIDLAVHSLKDLPTDVVDGLTLAATPQRETVHDVLLSSSGEALSALRSGAVVGTGSLRRRAQLLHIRSDLKLVDLRGNVDTRLAKLAAGNYDAIVLAHAGLKRLGLDHHLHIVLPVEQMLPAVGQGALGIEVRTDDVTSLAAVRRLDDPATHSAVMAERALLAALRGGCLAPVGAWARCDQQGALQLDAAVLSVDGRTRLTVSVRGAPAAAVDLGQQAADQLLTRGAAELISASRAG